MASTRNINSYGNYELEQEYKKKSIDYLMFDNSCRAYSTHHAGNGLLEGRIAPTELSQNSCDIESFLYGIGTNNLVDHYRPPKGELIRIQQLHIIEQPKIIIPEKFEHNGGQRPLFR